MSPRFPLSLLLAAALALGATACDDDPANSTQEEDVLEDSSTGDGTEEDTGEADLTEEDITDPDATTETDVPEDTTTTADATPDATTDTTTDSGTPDIPPPDPTGEDCSNGVDDDGDNDVDCDDADCDATPVCTDEICDNGVDDDRDSFTDCDDLECRSASICLVENCTNGKDDDGDSDADCDDSDCATSGACSGLVEDCANGIDDDSDGLTDCRDPACWDNTNNATDACTDTSNARPCAADGQQCNPSLGFIQNDYICIASGTPGVTAGFPGLGLCFETCDPTDIASCDLGSACFDPNASDVEPSGFCVARSCSIPFARDSCDAGSECTPYANGYLYCDSVGSLGEGEACDDTFGGPVDSKCGEGLTCVAEQCRPACDLSAPSCDAGESCIGLHSDVGYGVCDVECEAFSGDEGCEAANETCSPNYTGAWVCRPDSGIEEGEACQNFQDCVGDLVCVLGVCQKSCSYFASGECAENEICVGFDSQNQFGTCAEGCENLLPDTCSDTAERCIDFGSGRFGCAAHGGLALGDACDNYLDCGQNLYCNQPQVGAQGTCDELCIPFDAPANFCPENEACLPFSSDIGGCAPTTRTGDAQNAACTPRDALCGDALYCGQGIGGGNVCYALCRLDQSDGSGRANPDCGSPTETCNPNFGWADLGVCVP